jgi:hypothetical protein
MRSVDMSIDLLSFINQSSSWDIIRQKIFQSFSSNRQDRERDRLFNSDWVWDPVSVASGQEIWRFYYT